jgi:hypothetical protein
MTIISVSDVRCSMDITIGELFRRLHIYECLYLSPICIGMEKVRENQGKMYIYVCLGSLTDLTPVALIWVLCLSLRLEFKVANSRFNKKDQTPPNPNPMMDTSAPRSPSFEPREIYAEVTLPFALDVRPSHLKFATAILLGPAGIPEGYVTYISPPPSLLGLIKHDSVLVSSQGVPSTALNPRRSNRSG